MQCSKLISAVLLFLCLLLLSPVTPGTAAAPAAATLSLPQITLAPGADETVTLNLQGNPGGILGIDITLSYDPAVVTLTDVAKTPLTANWSLLQHEQPAGTVQIGLAGANALVGDGALLSLTFQAVGTEGSSTALTLLKGDLNEGAIASSLTSGGILVSSGTHGDCNSDTKVDAGDISALVLEIFDGDGAMPAGAPGGTFPGDPVGCDANADAIIDAGDISCTVLLIFNGQGACTVANTSSSHKNLVDLP